MRRAVPSLKSRRGILTWPPSIPARPYPDSTAYGLGDWFVASLTSSVVAWPAVFITDWIWADVLFPAASTMQPFATDCLAGLSLVPKAAASYLGAHIFVPKAWWFWKLSLIPALPVSLGLSLVIHVATTHSPIQEKVYDDWLPMKPTEQESSQVNTMYWMPSLPGDKPAATRFVEAAPRPVQGVLQWYMLPKSDAGASTSVSEAGSSGSSASQA